MKFIFGLQHPLTCNPWTTLSNPCNKVRGKNIVKEVFLRFPSCACLWCCVVVMLNDDVDDYITQPQPNGLMQFLLFSIIGWWTWYIHIYIYIYIYIYHRHHRVTLIARIFMTLSLSLSLSQSSITPWKSSCWSAKTGMSMCWDPKKNVTYEFVLASRCFGFLVRFTWMVLEIGSMWPYSCCLEGLYSLVILQNSSFRSSVVPI